MTNRHHQTKLRRIEPKPPSGAEPSAAVAAAVTSVQQQQQQTMMLPLTVVTVPQVDNKKKFSHATITCALYLYIVELEKDFRPLFTGIYILASQQNFQGCIKLPLT